MEDFKRIIQSVKDNIDNPEELSKLCVEASSFLYFHNQSIAEAELEEKKSMVNLMNDSVSQDENGKIKKMSATEAESRSVVETDNLYKRKLLEGEAIKELINSIKKRIEVLSFEHKNG